jgi:hypothetical protein
LKSAQKCFHLYFTLNLKEILSLFYLTCCLTSIVYLQDAFLFQCKSKTDQSVLLCSPIKCGRSNENVEKTPSHCPLTLKKIHTFKKKQMQIVKIKIELICYLLLVSFELPKSVELFEIFYKWKPRVWSNK